MTPPTVHLHISEAYLCPCGVIGNSSTVCACGNETLLSLGVVLDQERKPPTNAQVRALIDTLDEVLAQEKAA